MEKRSVAFLLQQFWFFFVRTSMIDSQQETIFTQMYFFVFIKIGNIFTSFSGRPIHYRPDKNQEVDPVYYYYLCFPIY